MVDFKKLKANRSESLANLTKEIEKLQTPQNGPDERFWRPELDKAGNGFAIIRFLPAPNDESTPFVRLWEHSFQGPGGWYIEYSRTTLGQGEPDPMSEYNTKLWNSGIESQKKFVQEKTKRRLHYISNIYVVKHSARPEDEGKVFLYKYGKKIFDKLQDALYPQFDEAPFNPFDLWEGANFKLKIRKLDGYPNYDKSEFEEAGPLFDDDAILEKIWKSEHSLQAEIAPNKFKTYDELKARMNKALALEVDSQSGAKKANTKVKEDTPPWEDSSEKSTDGDDSDLDFFKRLAEED
jgi:hypothetical protein